MEDELSQEFGNIEGVLKAIEAKLPEPLEDMVDDIPPRTAGMNDFLAYVNEPKKQISREDYTKQSMQDRGDRLCARWEAIKQVAGDIVSQARRVELDEQINRWVDQAERIYGIKVNRGPVRGV